MRFVDEYRDPAAARLLVSHIAELAGERSFKFMEVCGGHTHTIYRHGIEHVLPETVELVHGPGCPVCVIPMGRVDDAIAVAETPGVIFTSFGDMMRVPGGNGNLLEAKARGADVRSCTRRWTRCGSRSTTPTARWSSSPSGSRRPPRRPRSRCCQARELGVSNFRVFCNHVTIVPPIRAILESPDLRLDGFLGPGHVSTVVGNRPYRFVPETYGKPFVTARASSRSTSCRRSPCCLRRSATGDARSRTSTRVWCATRATRGRWRSWPRCSSCGRTSSGAASDSSRRAR